MRHAYRGILKGCLEFCPAFAEALFDQLLGANVARDICGAGYGACLIADRRNGDNDVERPAILVKPDGLKVGDRLARRNISEKGLFLLQPVRRDDVADRLADHLLFAITEHALSGAIPADDDTLKRLAHDGIGGGGDCGGRQRTWPLITREEFAKSSGPKIAANPQRSPTSL